MKKRHQSLFILLLITTGFTFNSAKLFPSAGAQSLPSTVYADRFPGVDAGAKIVAAIASLPSSGGIVDAKALSGSQIISGSILINKPVRLILGEGIYTFTGTGVNQYNSIIVLFSPGSSVEGQGQDKTNIFTKTIYMGVDAFANTTIKNLTLTGPGREVTAKEATAMWPSAPYVSTGINSGDQDNVTVDRVTIRNWGTHGLNTGAYSDGWIVTNNRVENNWLDGILFAAGSSNGTISNNLAINNGANGIDVTGSGNTISNNIVRNNGYNFPNNIDSQGIMVTSIWADVPADNNKVINNLVEGNGGNIIIRSATDSQTLNTLVSGNTVLNAVEGDGIAVDGAAEGILENTQVMGNIVRGNKRHGILVIGSYSKSPVKNTLISNNTVEGNEASGIVVQAVPHNLVSGTIVKDNTLAANGSPQIFTDWSVNTTLGLNAIISQSSGLISPRLTLKAEPLAVSSGQPATLAWTSNAVSVSIDGGIGAVPTSGSIVVYPTKDTVYTVTALGPNPSDPQLFGRSVPGTTTQKTVKEFLVTVFPATAILVGDINKDGIVNSVDWSVMNTKWFTTDANSDLNKDGIVNSIDFSLLNSNWLKSG